MSDLKRYRASAARELTSLLNKWGGTAAPESDAKIDELIRTLKNLPPRPESRKPYEGLFKLPSQAEVVAKIQFSMDLGWSADLRLGKLVFFDIQGRQLLNVVATTGAIGYQSEEHFWLRQLGPIPPMEDYQIATEAHWCPELPGVEGWWHDILPWDVYGPNGQSRSAFGLHWDSNHGQHPGSAGCIVIISRESMLKASNLLKAAKAAGVSAVPLEVLYNGKKPKAEAAPAKMPLPPAPKPPVVISTPETQAPDIYSLTVDPESALKNDQSLIAIAVGTAEGTRAPDGRFTAAYAGHTDPGNGATNLGSFSYQGEAGSPQEADRVWLAQLRELVPIYRKYAEEAGFDPKNALLLCTVCDLYTQAPLAVLSKCGFLDLLDEMKQKPFILDTLINFRVKSFYEPDGRLNAPGFDNDPERLRADQERRMQAIAEALKGYAAKA